MPTRIFLDCGFYIGHATKKYQEADTIDKTWDIYAFEPYPHKEIKKLLEARLPLKVKLIKKAVWTKGGYADFLLKGREDAHHINLDGIAEGDQVVKVPTIDFSKFVAKLPEATIICSMDIEGSEFEVLEKMLKDNTIDRIKILDIEFHHRLLADYDEKDSAKLIREIRKRGVKVKLKVPLH